MNHKISVITISLMVLLVGCFNIKSEYPSNNYYNLTQEKTETGVGVEIPGTLLLKDVQFPEQYNTQLIIERLPDSKVKKYNYHKWIDLPAVLATDFIKTRLNMHRAFSGSIIYQGSLIHPDYILEITVLEFEAFSKKKESYVALSAKAMLIKREKDSPTTETLLSKVYEKKKVRSNKNVSSIAPAFSELFSDITDLIAYDVQSKILEEK